MIDIDQIQADVDFVENDPGDFWAIARAVWRLYLAIPDMAAEVKLLRNKQRETVVENMKDILCSAFSSKSPQDESLAFRLGLQGEITAQAVDLLKSVIGQSGASTSFTGHGVLYAELAYKITQFLKEQE